MHIICNNERSSEVIYTTNTREHDTFLFYITFASKNTAYINFIATYVIFVENQECPFSVNFEDFPILFLKYTVQILIQHPQIDHEQLLTRLCLLRHNRPQCFLEGFCCGGSPSNTTQTATF